MTAADAGALVVRVLGGDRLAARTLVERLAPLIHKVVGRCLIRCRAPARGDAHQMAHDLVQQVFVALLENDMRVMRQWDPRRGRAFTSFVALIAEREVWSVLRSAARNPLMEEAIETPDELKSSARVDPIQSPEEAAISSELMASVLHRVRDRLGERGMLLFQMVVVEERPAEEISAITGMTIEAVYAWHSRLRRMVRALQSELASSLALPARTGRKAAR